MKIFRAIVVIICILAIGFIIFLLQKENLSPANKIALYLGMIPCIFGILTPLLPDLFKKDSPTPSNPQSIEGNNNTQQSAQGDINNTQGVPPELVNKWMDMLNRKDEVIQQQGNELQELEKKYFEVQKDLEQQKDKITDKNLKEEANQAYLELKEGNFNKAEDIYNKLYNLKKEDIKEAADYAYQLGNVYYTQIKYSEAQKWYEQAVRLSPENPEYLNSLGIVCYDMGDYKKAIDYLNKSLSIKKAVLGDNHPSVADTLNNLGLVYRSMGDYKKAIDYLNKSLSITKAVLGDNHPDVAGTLNNLGTAYGSMGDYKKAIDYLNKSLSITKAVLGDKHPSVADTLNNLGLVYRSMGNYEKAIEYLDESLSIKKAVLGDKHPSVADTLNNLGIAYGSMRDYKKAIKYFEKSLSITKAVLGEKHPSMSEILNNLGVTYRLMGDYKKAIEYFEKSLSITKAILGEKHPNVAGTLNNLGFAYSSKGDYKKAIVYLKKALNIYNLVYKNGINPNIKTVHTCLAIVYEKLSNDKLANEHREKAEEISKKLDEMK